MKCFMGLGGLNDRNRVFSSSQVTEMCANWNTPIPVEQYMHIRLPDDKVVSIEFFGRTNSGRIVLKRYSDRTSQDRDDVEDIILEECASEQELLDGLQAYRTDLSLKELLEKKLSMKNSQLSALETEAKEYDEAESLLDQIQQKQGQNIGE